MQNATTYDMFRQCIMDFASSSRDVVRYIFRRFGLIGLIGLIDI